ncbi:hypothetical protein FGSG_12253 [Fusarium graminearum PH-1]|uniref:Chromosome 2, complete genome n=1 Tax=Gibberella zeae (strain ATCC MYA-4620 / CBS 123657 / FGSC 9075 / NRRL 31084 / PH-1) TaxID=229533 RepID=I1S5Y2_GIBZE|nr:hypothetical protein FGSG_12253 [Fusarium graminearum PH-1]ESU08640.1 hypothetical protein FGSG_12253 [Fusarium graminearum PH-1]CEF79478.1 unnamed protein product [Fusarium graminearum]|eukprot:XP_011321139.1 hypothetical protein FGSG_12253 [Fusarium graminearum PH-1]
MTRQDKTRWTQNNRTEASFRNPYGRGHSWAGLKVVYNKVQTRARARGKKGPSQLRVHRETPVMTDQTRGSKAHTQYRPVRRGEGGVDARCAATIPKSKGRGRSLVLGAEEREGVRNARPLNGVAVVCRYRGYVRARALVQLPGYLNLRRAIGQDRACAGQRWAPPPGPFAPRSQDEAPRTTARTATV